MAITLKAKISNSQTSYEHILGGGVRRTRVITAVIETDEPTPRRFGPVERVFDANVQQTEIDNWLDEERRALEGRV